MLGICGRRVRPLQVRIRASELSVSRDGRHTNPAEPCLQIPACTSFGDGLLLSPKISLSLRLSQRPARAQNTQAPENTLPLESPLQQWHANTLPHHSLTGAFYAAAYFIQKLFLYLARSWPFRLDAWTCVLGGWAVLEQQEIWANVGIILLLIYCLHYRANPCGALRHSDFHKYLVITKKSSKKLWI